MQCVRMESKHSDPELRELTDFVRMFSIRNLPSAAIDRLKIHLLDSLGCALGALNAPPVVMQRQSIVELGGNEQASILGTGKRLAVDRSAQHYTALTRYLDFMDNFIAKHGTCHPSDNIGSVLAVCEWKDLPGRDLLEAMALAYNVQCRMIEAEPSMDKGFDHTTQLSFSIAAGVSKALQLNQSQTQNAIAICGTTFNPFVVVRAPHTSQWKGIISSQIAFGCVNCCLLAQNGMTGPLDVFTGVGGYNENFSIKHSAKWKSIQAELYEKLIIKKYNAEVHTQTAIEACLGLRQFHQLDPGRVKKVEVEIFQTAYDITGGGKYGPRDKAQTKEDADHSLPYVLAVALIDGQVSPAQYNFKRIVRADVQALMKRVTVRTKLPISKPKVIVEHIDPYTRQYPEKLMCTVKIELDDGKTIHRDQASYHGFNLEPCSWEDVENKFRMLTSTVDRSIQQRIIETVKHIEDVKTRDLTQALNSAIRS
jgi:2-methylcitrate dehydratase